MVKLTGITHEREITAAEQHLLQELLLPQYHTKLQIHGRNQMLQSGLNWGKWTAVF